MTSPWVYQVTENQRPTDRKVKGCHLMAVIKLAAIYRYPVKSLRGEAFGALDIGSRGFLYDRHWMVVDDDGRFLTQRQLPRMALVTTTVLDQGRLRLQAPDMPELVIEPGGNDDIRVTIWHDQVDAALADPQASDWLSRFLQRPCRLVVMPEQTTRAVNPDYAAAQDQVGFADGFPFLLISQGSLDDLNARLEQAVPMQRFRPNLVVEGCEPYAEDGWRRVRIGELTFRVAKPCSRCIIPTIDIDTATRSPEPLRTLMSYRKRDNKIYFGQNLIHDGPGRLEVDMPVEVLE